MACSLTSARGLACKDKVGGVKAIYLADYNPLAYAAMTFTSGTWTAYGAVNYTIYRYDVRPSTSGLVCDVTNEAAGSAAYASKATVTLHKATQTDNNELQKLIQGRVFCWVLDANDQLWMLGAVNGCVVNTAQMSIGTARTDLHGYTLEIEAMEAAFPIAVTPSTDPADVDWPFDGLTGTGTITVTNPA